MTRLTAKDFAPELLELYDGYVHGTANGVRLTYRPNEDRLGWLQSSGYVQSISLFDEDEIHTVVAQLRGGEDGHVLRRGARLQGDQGGVKAGAAQPGSQQLNLTPLIGPR